jgi:hypothetical protein
MQYVLGNMLNGGGGLNADGLSLDLQFAADKTLAARRGPTPAFSRASSGIFVNANGLIVGKTAGTTSSITPSTQAIGSQVTVTVASGSVVGWVVGQAISLIVDTDGQDDPDATELWLLGNIVSTTGTTLVFEVTSRTAQAGSATSWTLGYRGPRFDHDPVTLVCRGLLIEESRTNLSLQSGVIVNNSGWATLDVTAAVSGTGLDGNNAYKISEAASTNIHALVNLGGTGAASATSVVSGTNYTGSVFVKKVTGSVDWVQLTLGTAGFGALQFANFNIGNGTIGNYTGLTSGTVPRIQEFPNGWYRISMTAPATATATTSNVILAFTNNTDTTTRAPSYLGSTSNEVLTSLWQFEAGSFATSYIPTTTGTLARSADVCSIANTASFWNSDQFTLFGNANFPNPAHDAYAANFSITNGYFGVRRPNTNTAAAIIRSSGVNADISLGTFVTGTMRMAVAHSSGQQAAAFNGGSATQASSAFSPSLNPALNIGYSGSAGYINGHIAAIRYYKKRLPNARLAQLTA